MSHFPMAFTYNKYSGMNAFYSFVSSGLLARHSTTRYLHALPVTYYNAGVAQIVIFLFSINRRRLFVLKS
jgi:hypothetical protein